MLRNIWKTLNFPFLSLCLSGEQTPPKCMLYLKSLVKIIFVDEMNVSNGKEVQVQIEQITQELPMSPAYLPSC